MTFFLDDGFLKQFISDDMLFIFDRTNIKIEQMNSHNLTSQKRIRKINIWTIKLRNQNLDINFQNKVHIIQIISKFFKIFQNFSTFTFDRVIFRFKHILRAVFVFTKMSFFIFDLHKYFFSVFQTDVCC